MKADDKTNKPVFSSPEWMQYLASPLLPGQTHRSTGCVNIWNSLILSPPPSLSSGTPTRFLFLYPSSLQLFSFTSFHSYSSPSLSCLCLSLSLSSSFLLYSLSLCFLPVLSLSFSPFIFLQFLLFPPFVLPSYLVSTFSLYLLPFLLFSSLYSSSIPRPPYPLPFSSIISVLFPPFIFSPELVSLIFSLYLLSFLLSSFSLFFLSILSPSSSSNPALSLPLSFLSISSPLSSPFIFYHSCSFPPFICHLLP